MSIVTCNILQFIRKYFSPPPGGQQAAPAQPAAAPAAKRPRRRTRFPLPVPLRGRLPVRIRFLFLFLFLFRIQAAKCFSSPHFAANRRGLKPPWNCGILIPPKGEAGEKPARARRRKAHKNRCPTEGRTSGNAIEAILREGGQPFAPSRNTQSAPPVPHIASRERRHFRTGIIS